MSIAIRFRVKMWLASTNTLDSAPRKMAATDANRTQTHGRELEEDFSGASQQTEA
jgi:hypothetical protein